MARGTDEVVHCGINPGTEFSEKGIVEPKKTLEADDLPRDRNSGD